MMTTSVPTIFHLDNGSTLVVASGTRWEMVHQGRPNAINAEEEVTRLREYADELVKVINAMHALHGGKAIR